MDNPARVYTELLIGIKPGRIEGLIVHRLDHLLDAAKPFLFGYAAYETCYARHFIYFPAA